MEIKREKGGGGEDSESLCRAGVDTFVLSAKT